MAGVVCVVRPVGHFGYLPDVDGCVVQPLVIASFGCVDILENNDGILFPVSILFPFLQCLGLIHYLNRDTLRGCQKQQFCEKIISRRLIVNHNNLLGLENLGPAHCYLAVNQPGINPCHYYITH